MRRSSRLHLGIPATTFGSSPGHRLHGLLLAVFFGGEFLPLCVPRSLFWFGRTCRFAKDGDLALVSCRACRRLLARAGLLDREPGRTFPLFPELFREGAPPPKS